MQTRVEVLYARQGRSEAAWGAVVRLAAELRAAHPAVRVIEAGGALVKVLLPDEAAPEGATWRRLHAEAERAGAVGLVSRVHLFDDAELRAADLASVSGVSLDARAPFVRNAAAALPRVVPCATCGVALPWDRPQVADLVVDESLLDGPVDGRGPPPAGWPLVNLEGGGLAISRSVFDGLLAAGVRGLVARPLVALATGEASTRVVQALAEVASPVPCLTHTELAPHTQICPCGTVHGAAIPAPMPTFDLGPLDGRAVFSRHPLRAALLTFDRASRDALAGLCAPFAPVLGSPAKACVHR